jgi:hypothetical protein
MRAIAVLSQSSAADAPPPHRRPSSSEQFPSCVVSPSPFSPSCSKLPCPRAAARPSSSELLGWPWPQFIVDQCRQWSTSGGSSPPHFFHWKKNLNQENPHILINSPLPFCEIKLQSRNFQTERQNLKIFSDIALASF